MNFRLTILLWAARDLMRRPFPAILTAAALFCLTVFASMPLLLSNALSNTAQTLLEEGPSIVARRISAGQWAPLPIVEAVDAALSVPGVISARPRIWGVVGGPEGPVTVLGLFFEKNKNQRKILDTFTAPSPGQAVIGPGVLSSVGNEVSGELPIFSLLGEISLTVKAVDIFDKRRAMALHDVVLLHEQDARNLLGLPPGFASDLAIRVFHQQESEAVIAELSDAFPWQSRMTTRSETLKMYTASMARRGGLFYFFLTPGLLAMALIVSAAFRDSDRGAYEAGLFKAMGWTSADIVRLFMYKAIFISAPSIAAAAATAFWLVHWPGTNWPALLFLGWKNASPGFYLDPSGSIPALLLAAAAVFTPFFAANLWPAVRVSAADPGELMTHGGAL